MTDSCIAHMLMAANSGDESARPYAMEAAIRAGSDAEAVYAAFGATPEEEAKVRDLMLLPPIFEDNFPEYEWDRTEEE